MVSPDSACAVPMRESKPALRAFYHLLPCPRLVGILNIANAMMRNDTIKHLDMASNFSGNRGAFEWANVIKRNPSLTRLSLTDNEISEQGGALLLAALQHNKAVRFFGIGGQSVVPPYGNQLSLALRCVSNSLPMCLFLCLGRWCVCCGDISRCAQY